MVAEGKDRKKKRFQSKRDEKVQALKSRPELWRGLEEVEYA